MNSVVSWRLAERGRLRIERLAFLLLRYGLVLVLVWTAMKATDPFGSISIRSKAAMLLQLRSAARARTSMTSDRGIFPMR